MTTPAGFSRLTFKPLGIVQRFAIIIHRHAFQAVKHLAGRMMLLLALDVLRNPIELPFAEAYDAKTTLPLKGLETPLLIHLVRTAALELAYEVANTN